MHLLKADDTDLADWSQIEMLDKKEIERYSRQLQLPGWDVETQLKLKNARVLVVGAGALGCAVLQNLSLAGMGVLGIADNDIVSFSNLQRQVLFDENTVGSGKAQTAAEKVERLNSFVKTEVYGERIFEGNVLEILKKFDVIVDGSDNFETKYLLNDACVILKKPLVSGSIEAFEGQVSVFNFKEGPTYRCLFPEAPAKENSTDCNTIGVTTTLPLVIGNIQANEVVKIVSGLGEPLSGKVLLVNMLNNSFLTLSVKTNPANKNITEINARHDFTNCTRLSVKALSALQFKKVKNDFWLIDVRNETEHAAFNIGGKNIPVYEIDSSMEMIPSEKKILTYCNEGMMAKQAALLISKKKNQEVYYLDSPLATFKND